MRVSYPGIFLALVLLGCEASPLIISTERMGDGIAQFVVKNRSNRDVRAAAFVVTFGSANGEPVQVDTVRYDRTTGAGGTEQPFVEAGGDTFFSTKTPPGATSATGAILYVRFVDGSTWPRREPNG